LLILPIAAHAAPCAGFTDVDDSSSFCVNVVWVKNRNITLGCTSPTLYCPNNAVTRLQMAAFLNRLGNVTFQQGGNAFGAPGTLGTTDGQPLRIQLGAGNVGVGTNAPQSKFHVTGTSWFQGDNTPLPAAAGTGVAIGSIPGTVVGYVFAFDYAQTQWRNLIFQHGGGRVGIGTLMPSDTLDVVAASGNAIRANSDNIGVVAAGAGIAGVLGASNLSGVYGRANGSLPLRAGVFGIDAGSGPAGYAGRFQGNVDVAGTLTKTSGAFLIDHPLDPANKFLSHSFVESPDMKNIYDGLTTTDNEGLAVVVLPDWFEALNRDFRYQLTVIGQFAQAIVAREIEAGRFEIRTDRPTVKVSWQVTGIRKDPYADANRIVVETEKPAELRGAYVYPRGYGKPESDSIGSRTRPDRMIANEGS
jgi:hypothetical protein